MVWRSLFLLQKSIFCKMRQKDCKFFELSENKQGLAILIYIHLAQKSRSALRNEKEQRERKKKLSTR